MQAGPYHYMYTVAGPDRLTRAERARHWELLEILKTTRATLDPEPLIPFLAEGIIYESQSILNALTGKESVTKHLRGKHKALRGMLGTRDVGKFIAATMDLPRGRQSPCLIFEVDGKWDATFHLTLDRDELISRIDIFTVLPPPHEAVPLPPTGDPKLA